MYGEDPCSVDSLGVCEWEPDGGLPHSWQYVHREVTLVRLNEQHDCPQFTNPLIINGW